MLGDERRVAETGEALACSEVVLAVGRCALLDAHGEHVGDVVGERAERARLPVDDRARPSCAARSSARLNRWAAFDCPMYTRGR